MGESVAGILKMFRGKSGKEKAVEAAAAQDRSRNALDRTRNAEEARRAREDTAGASRAGGRAPRGRRLLVSEDAGGLASTIGEAI